jgi:hypothetical protein
LSDRHLAERHLAERHLAERHLAEKHLAERHLAERHLAERHLANTIFSQHGYDYVIWSAFILHKMSFGQMGFRLKDVNTKLDRDC